MVFLSCGSRRPVKRSPSVGRSIGPPPTVSELCTLLVFLLDVIPLVGPLLSRGGSMLAVIGILISGVGLFLNLILPTDFSCVTQSVKNLPAMQEIWLRSLGQEDPLEKGMATYSSILAWRIPMDRGAWWATVPGVAKSQTRLSDWTITPASILLKKWLCIDTT